MKYYLTALVLLISSVFAIAQEQPLSPKASAKGDNIEVSYGQPSKRGRTIFGDLVPYGEVWRAGANEATQVTFKKNGTFGDKAVKAGTYVLFVIPAEKEWTVILNSQTGQWGSYDYEKHKAKNVAEIKAPVTTTGTVKEKLTYTVKKDALIIEWDKASVSVPVKF